MTTTKGNFEVCPRALVISRGKILFVKHKKSNWFFLPGGHVEFGESVERALAREMREELGVNVKSSKFIGAIDNVYSEKNILHDELNLVFAVTTGRKQVESQEDHLQFVWLGKNEIARAKILPPVMKKQLAKWLKDKRTFWASQVRK